MAPRKPKPAVAKKPSPDSGKITKPNATAQPAQRPIVYRRYGQKGGGVQITEETHLNLNYENFDDVYASRSVTRVPLAFRLPEVCRQIYSETALTAYRENTFVFDETHWPYKNAKTQLIAAQRRAITSIEPDPLTFVDMMLLSGYREEIRLKRLPNVETVFVTSRAMRCLELHRTRSTSDVEKRFWERNNGANSSQIRCNREEAVTYMWSSGEATA
ncbi:hypothetical protein EJ07DRAFT_154871 [Lizonia empirigonia]|nr:hypothetical protein EJ07DRAFT_154871 [Lizonia empirigonia]